MYRPDHFHEGDRNSGRRNSCDSDDERRRSIFPPDLLDRMARSNRGGGINIDLNSGRSSVGPEVYLGAAVFLGKLLFGGDDEAAAERRQRMEAENQAEQERSAREAAEKQAKQERSERQAAEKQAKEERLAREAAEQKRSEMERLGICPDRVVTENEIQAARIAVGYVPGRVNIGVTGVCKAGKSTLVNCLRGTEYDDPTEAKVAEVLETKTAKFYIDDHHSNNVYHDLPGGNVSGFTSWGYYYKQKLFAYDKILLVHTDTPTELDVKINQICKLRGQECISVRTKADIHISNNHRRKKQPTVEAARQDYIAQVEADTKRLNANASQVEELCPNFTDYIISEMGTSELVKGTPPSTNPFEQVIDERKLLGRLGLNGFMAGTKTTTGD